MNAVRGLFFVIIVFTVSCAGKSPKSSKGELDVGAPGKYQAEYREGRAIADVRWIETFDDGKLDDRHCYDQPIR